MEQPGGASYEKKSNARNAGAGVSALLTLAPQALDAQTGEFTPAALDAWRAKLMERLDRDVAELSVPTPRQPPTPVVNAWRNGQRPVAQPVWSPLAGQGRRLPWLPAVAAILREHSLPPELVGVAAVESGLDPAALSPEGARGLWQLMPETATRYGLVVNAESDERLDPMKSTRAAARYLKELLGQFQDWPLALAAYNAGEQRVERAMDRLGARDFWTLSRQAALPDETRRYVPVVLARVGMALEPRSLQASGIPPLEPALNRPIPPGRDAATRPSVVYAASLPAF